jgi:DnaJ-class molecular chaperone
VSVVSHLIFNQLAHRKALRHLQETLVLPPTTEGSPPVEIPMQFQEACQAVPPGQAETVLCAQCGGAGSCRGTRCLECNGKGRRLSERRSQVPCTQCGGTGISKGYLRYSDDSSGGVFPRGIPEGRCPECDGTGRRSQVGRDSLNGHAEQVTESTAREKTVRESTIPSQPPGIVPCSQCSGTGSCRGTKCLDCLGKGKLRVSRVPCQQCNGIGSCRGSKCLECNGKGTILAA